MPQRKSPAKVSSNHLQQALFTEIDQNAQSGDLFDAEAQTITITVNCVGIMGKGLALEAKRRFPDVYATYADLCKRGEMRLCEPVLVKRPTSPWVLLFPTKGHWRSVSRLSDITAGLRFLVQNYKTWGINSLAVPPLGCGNGGLQWTQVGPIIQRELGGLDIPVQVFGPLPNEGNTGMTSARKMDQVPLPEATIVTPNITAVLVALRQILEINSDQVFGRVLIQKLAYFAKVAGIVLPFSFQRNPYGPFSKEWKQYLTQLVNDGLLVEATAGRKRDGFLYKPGPGLTSIERTQAAKLRKYHASIHRLAGLMARLSAEQAEMAATVHMVAVDLAAKSDGIVNVPQVIEQVQQWKRGKPTIFTAARIEACLRWLVQERWIAAQLDNAESESQELASSFLQLELLSSRA